MSTKRVLQRSQGKKWLTCDNVVVESGDIGRRDMQIGLSHDDGVRKNVRSMTRENVKGANVLKRE
jgi:hypothetical protein